MQRAASEEHDLPDAFSSPGDAEAEAARVEV